MQNNKVPIIFLAFANEKVEGQRYLRKLSIELNGIYDDALREAERRNMCEVITRSSVTLEQIKSVFEDDRYRDRIAVFHFGGHADGYQLLLRTDDAQNETAHAEGLVSFLSRQQNLQLIFLNGCTTHQQCKELSEKDIPYVIGTENSIADNIACQLAIEFYKALAQQMPIQRAWEQTIDFINSKYIKGGTKRELWWEGKEDFIEETLPWEIYRREDAKEWKLKSIDDLDNFIAKGQLNLLIISQKKDTIEIGLDKEYYKDCYENKIEDWKPFKGEDSIKDMLEEYQKQVSFKIHPYYFEKNTSSLILDERKIHFIKEHRDKIVLILDPITLFNKNLEQIIKKFDEKDIGGCLVLVCQSRSFEYFISVKEKVNETLSFLSKCYINYKKKFLHFIYPITTKEMFFRHLSNIAFGYLEIPSQIESQSEKHKEIRKQNFF